MRLRCNARSTRYMSSKPNEADFLPGGSILRGMVKAPRLYVGKIDAELDLYQTPMGDVAAVTIADSQKPGPNEDSAAIIPVDDSHLVLLVADGVGGLNGARQASNLVASAIRDSLASIDDIPGRGLRTAIMDGIETANRLILQSSGNGASTLALAEIGPGYVRSYHVGDSIFLLCGQRGRIKAQTVPHSPVGFAMEAGLLNEKEAINHDELNLIFNVLGSADMSIEVGSEQPMAAHDTLLLASDGLTDNLLVDEIVSAIRKGPLDAAVRRLTVAAQDRMQTARPGKPSKPDDYTALIYRRSHRTRKAGA